MRHPREQPEQVEQPLRQLSTGEDASFYFQRFDRTGRGELDVQEFGSLLLELGLLKAPSAAIREPSRIPRGSLASHEIHAKMAMAKPLGPELSGSKQWLHEEFFKADKGSDGLLSFDEFRIYWERVVLPQRKTFSELYLVHKKLLGEGAFGSVRKATQLATGREVAIKQIRKDEMSMIHGEMAIWEGLRHPGLLSLLDVQETDQHVLLITEIMPGGDLFEALCKLGRSPLSHLPSLTCHLSPPISHLSPLT